MEAFSDARTTRMCWNAAALGEVFLLHIIKHCSMRDLYIKYCI